MANEVVNKDDLHDVRDTINDNVDKGLSGLSQQMQHGIGGVNARLDVLNGRVRKGEVVDAEHEIRLDNLERDGREKKPRSPLEADENAAITRRDLKVAVAVISAMYVLAQLVFKVLPLLAKWGQP